MTPATDEEIENVRYDGFQCDCGAAAFMASGGPASYTNHQRSCASIIGPKLLSSVDAYKAVIKEMQDKLDALQEYADRQGVDLRAAEGTLEMERADFAEKIARLAKAIRLLLYGCKCRGTGYELFDWSGGNDSKECVKPACIESRAALKAIQQ